jgi:hypothetical protein
MNSRSCQGLLEPAREHGLVCQYKDSNHFVYLSVLISRLHLRGQAQIALRLGPPACRLPSVPFKETDQTFNIGLPLIELAQKAP